MLRSDRSYGYGMADRQRYLQNNVPYIWKMGLLLVLAAIGLTCSITAQYFAAKAAVGFATKLRHAVFEHIESLSFTEMDEAEPP